MIATYATPVSSEEGRSTSAVMRRTSMPSLIGTSGLVSVGENCGSDVLRPVHSTSNRRNPDTHGSASPGNRKSSDTSHRRSLSMIDNSGSLVHDLQSTKPGIQCDLRRALSLDYQNRLSKMDISTECANYTQGAPLARRSPDRKRRDLSENLAHRLHRERTINPSFYDVI